MLELQSLLSERTVAFYVSHIPMRRRFPEVKLEVEPPHEPTPLHVISRVHGAGKEDGFQNLHRDVLIKHDPDGDIFGFTRAV